MSASTLTATLRALRCALIVAALALLAAVAPGSAAAGTIHVAPGGSDAASGGADAPLATLTRAATVARAGDVVLVASGRYRESVKLSRGGVTFRGQGSARPIIDGEGTRRFGFWSNDRRQSGVTIENFELTRQTEAGIYLQGIDATIANNEIHHVGAASDLFGFGVHIVYGQRVRVHDNEIRSIGPGGESMGIKLTNTRDSVVSGNEIRLVRKEGVRDYFGLDNVIRDNQISLCWVGIAWNSSTGGAALNNYVHDTVIGLNPKHTSEPRVLAYWQLTAPRDTLIHQNTVYRSQDSSISLAMNAPAADHIDVRNNVFSGAGGAFVADAPKVRGTHVVLDGNVYSPIGGRPRWLYHTGYDFNRNGHADLAALRAALGWETHGRWEEHDAQKWGPTPPASAFSGTGGPQLNSGFGGQLGAAGLAPERVSWTPLDMTPIRSTSPGTWYTTKHLGESSDGVHHTYWLSESDRDESVTYDLGRMETFQQIVLDVYSHMDKRNVRGYRFEVSDDDREYRTVLAGENPDTLGSSYKYELPEAVRARYLRFTLVDTFCDSYAPRTGCGEYFVLSDLVVGRLTPSGAAREPWLPSEPLPGASATPAPVDTPPVAAPGKGPGGTGANAGQPPRPAGPETSVEVGSVKRRRGRVRVTLRCQTAQATRCAGTLTVAARQRGAKGGKAARTRTVARQAFSVRPGTRRVTVRLRSAAARALVRRRGVTVDARVRLRK